MHWKNKILTEAIKTVLQYDVIVITQVPHLLKRVRMFATQLLSRYKTHQIMMILKKRVSIQQWKVLMKNLSEKMTMQIVHMCLNRYVK